MWCAEEIHKNRFKQCALRDEKFWQNIFKFLIQIAVFDLLQGCHRSERWSTCSVEEVTKCVPVFGFFEESFSRIENALFLQTRKRKWIDEIFKFEYKPIKVRRLLVMSDIIRVYEGKATTQKKSAKFKRNCHAAALEQISPQSISRSASRNGFVATRESRITLFKYFINSKMRYKTIMMDECDMGFSFNRFFFFIIEWE